MKKRMTKIVGGAAIVGALALAASSGIGTASAKSLISKVGITKPSHDGRGPAKSLASVATVLKMTEAELKTQLDAGKSLADVAKAQGVNVQSVIDVIVTEVKAHIADEVKSGEITQAEADAKLADVTTKVTEMVNSVRPGDMGGRGHGGPAKSLASVATVLKMTEAELKTQLDAGKSLADVAKAQGVNVQSVIDVIVTEVKAHIADEVKSGEITQAEADAKLADVTTKVTEMVNSVRPGDMGGRGHGGRGGRGGHGHSHGMEGSGNIETPAGVTNTNA